MKCQICQKEKSNNKGCGHWPPKTIGNFEVIFLNGKTGIVNKDNNIWDLDFWITVDTWRRI